MRPKTSVRLSVNIDPVYCTVYVSCVCYVYCVYCVFVYYVRECVSVFAICPCFQTILGVLVQVSPPCTPSLLLNPHAIERLITLNLIFPPRGIKAFPDSQLLFYKRCTYIWAEIYFIRKIIFNMFINSFFRKYIIKHSCTYLIYSWIKLCLWKPIIWYSL